MWRTIIKPTGFTYKRCSYVVSSNTKEVSALLEEIRNKQSELQQEGIDNVVSIVEVLYCEEMPPLYGWV